MPTETLVTLEELDTYLDELMMPRRIDEVIIHHTWKPTAADYNGKSTIAAVRRYHMDVRGWSDNGYHVMVAPNGDLWLCRPMERSGAHTLGRNAHSIGLSYVANFDVDRPEEYDGWNVGIAATAKILLERFDLPVQNIRFHNEFAAKSCPGDNIDIEDYRAQVQEYLGGGAPEVKVVLYPPTPEYPYGTVVPCDPEVTGGVTRGDVTPLAEAMGFATRWDHDTNKCYLIPKGD